MCARTLFFSAASADFFWHASSEESHRGSTSAENASRRPSGDQTMSETPGGKLVSLRASPASDGMIQIWDVPSRLETNATRLPSGDQWASESVLSVWVSGRAPEPSAPASQSRDLRAPFFPSVVVTEYTMRRPSGEIRGLPTPWMR